MAVNMILRYSHLQLDLPQNGWDGMCQWGGDEIAACSVPDMYHLQPPCHGSCVVADRGAQSTMHVASNLVGPVDAQHACQLQSFQGCGMGESVPMMESNLSFGQGSWQGEGTNWGQERLSNQPFTAQQDHDTVDPYSSLPAELRPTPETSKATQCEEVDEDFERDVFNAVATFLQGNDTDSDSEDELEDSAETGPTADVPRSGDEQLVENLKLDPQLLTLMGQVDTRLQQKSFRSETPAATDLQLHGVKPGMLKLFEHLTSSQESPAPALAMPSAQPVPAPQALPKPSHLVRPSGRQSPIGPELQRGQCIGALLKMKPLPPGITAADLAHLRLLVT